MRSFPKLSLAGTLVASLASLAATPAAAAADNQNTITTDVVILGGGATGMYAAVQLTKQGHGVALVEQKSLLGGHAETLYLPNGEHVDYGVEGYFNNPITLDLFRLLGVEYEPLLPASLVTHHVNFRTGDRAPSNQGVLGMVGGTALYRAAIEQFDYLATGAYYLPSPVPEELLRPFREFVEKWSLQGALSVVFMFAQNVGNLLETPLLYVIQNFGIPQINALLGGGYVRPRQGTQDLFRKAASYVLGRPDNNILYNSTVSRADRSPDGVRLTVVTNNGAQTTEIRAKKLLVAYPPTLDAMAPFDLTAEEEALFSRWTTKNYYAAAITNTGLPDANVLNVDPANQPGSLPLPPFQWQLEYSGVPGYFMTKIVAEEGFSMDDARELIRSDLKRMRDAGTFATHDPEIKAMASHSPETLMVSVDDVRGGFYGKLYALQGVQSTFYTGYTFCTDYSTALWNYTGSVLDMMHL